MTLKPASPLAGSTLSTRELDGRHVYIAHRRRDGSDALKRHGKVRACVFHPTEARCVGLLVRRPDIAWMVKRPDELMPLGALSWDGSTIAWAEGASARSLRQAERAIGACLDDCVLWVGLPAVDRNGRRVGTVRAVAFDRDGGLVREVVLSEGAADDALLGVRRVPGERVVGFRACAAGKEPGAIVVDVGAEELKAEGGLAEVAGKQAAVATAKARQAVAKVAPAGARAADAAQEAASKAAFATGRQIGRASGMFAAFKEEFDKALREEDDD